MLLGCSWGLPGGLWSLLGRSWVVLWLLGEILRNPWTALGKVLGLLKSLGQSSRSWGFLVRSLGVLWAALGRVLWFSWVALGWPLAILGGRHPQQIPTEYSDLGVAFLGLRGLGYHSWVAFGCSLVVLGGSWLLLKRSWVGRRSSWTLLGGLGGSGAGSEGDLGDFWWSGGGVGRKTVLPPARRNNYFCPHPSRSIPRITETHKGIQRLRGLGMGRRRRRSS